MEKTKQLTLQCERKTYTDKATNVTREYWSWYVDVNGVKVYVKPNERLGYQLLNFACEGKE